MIICRVPFRVSFFGGGTDYPKYFTEHKGCVLGSAINKYCYLTFRKLDNFFEHQIRLVHSSIENIKNLNEITHPVFREFLKLNELKNNIEIHYQGDLPSKSGVGSSSSLIVGLNSIYNKLRNTLVLKRKLALDSMYFEQNILKETVGCQDQIFAAYGGLNKISFSKGKIFKLDPIKISTQNQNYFEDRLFLIHCGKTRIASKVAKNLVNNIKKRKIELQTMYDLAIEGEQVIRKKEIDIKEFGNLINESWKLKRSLSERISNSNISDIINDLNKFGAYGTKLCGAGGGGFILAIMEKDLVKKFSKKHQKLQFIPFKVNAEGSKIIYNQKLNNENINTITSFYPREAEANQLRIGRK